MIDLSIVVPVYNEEDNVDDLCRRVDDALGGLSLSHELIIVDDGSSDGTFDRLRDLGNRHSSLCVIKLRSNCGQTPAMRAGIDHARGSVIVTMDGDLQNDPSDIPKLLDKLGEGYELVAGWRKNRQDHAVRRNFPSRVANWIIRKVTGIPIHDNGCSLKAYRAEVIKKTPLYSEMHRFIPAMITVSGGRIAEIVVQHHSRVHGASKYGLSRIWRVMLDILTVKMVTTFADRPFHWFGLLSIVPAFLSAGFLALYLGNILTPTTESYGPMGGTVALLFFFLATNGILLGLFAELVSNTGKRLEYRAQSRILIHD